MGHIAVDIRILDANSCVCLCVWSPDCSHLPSYYDRLDIKDSVEQKWNDRRWEASGKVTAEGFDSFTTNGGKSSQRQQAK